MYEWVIINKLTEEETIVIGTTYARAMQGKDMNEWTAVCCDYID